MGVKREYGYREYPDDLTPGKDGESNLLFNPDGVLTTHADFHRTEADEDADGSRTSASPVARDLKIMAAGAAVAVIGAVVAKATKRALIAIRARRHAESDTQTQPNTQDGGDHAAVVSAEAEGDEQDALIEEVTSLCADGPATTQGTPKRPAVGEPVLEADEDRAKPRARRRRYGT